MTPARAGDPRKYMAALDYVRGLLAGGALRPGMPAPTIGALAERFGCTRKTARKALGLLADEGVLVRYPGLGYYVTGGLP